MPASSPSRFPRNRCASASTCSAKNVICTTNNLFSHESIASGYYEYDLLSSIAGAVSLGDGGIFEMKAMPTLLSLPEAAMDVCNGCNYEKAIVAMVSLLDGVLHSKSRRGSASSAA